MSEATLSVLDWQRLNHKLLRIYIGKPAIPHWHGAMHASLGAWLLLSGSVKTEDKLSGTQRFRAKSWVFLSDDYIGHDFSADAVVLAIRFRFHWTEHEALFQAKGTVGFPAAKYPELEVKARRLLAAAKNVDCAKSDHLLDLRFTLAEWSRLAGRFWDWIAVWGNAISQEQGTHPARIANDDRVQEAVRLISEWGWNRRWRETELARAVGLSVAQLNRVFVEHLKLTPKRYANAQRLESARKMLMRSRDSIKMIGYQLGFSHATQFTRWFHHHDGSTPEVFRETFRNPELRSD